MTETVTKVCCFRFAYHIPNLEFLRPKERFVVKVKAVVLLAAKKSQQEGILKLMARKGRSVHSGQKTQKQFHTWFTPQNAAKCHKMPQNSEKNAKCRKYRKYFARFARLKKVCRISKLIMPTVQYCASSHAPAKDVFHILGFNQECNNVRESHESILPDTIEFSFSIVDFFSITVQGILEMFGLSTYQISH